MLEHPSANLHTSPSEDNVLYEIDFSKNSNATSKITTELASIQQTTNPLPNSIKNNTSQEQFIDSTVVGVVEEGETIESYAFTKRIFYALLVAVVYAIIGWLVDCIINISKIISNNDATSMNWFFLPCLSVMGIVFGWCFGTKALDVVFGLFHSTPSENNPLNANDDFASGIMKAIGFGILIGIVGWFLLMILA